MNPRFHMLLLLVLVMLHATVACAQLDVPDQGGEACIVYIPTAISPNDDGINDTFSVQYACGLDGYQLRIYDDSQTLIYESEDVNATWDGTFQHEPMPEGHYSWMLTFYDPRTGNRELQKGTFVLIR
jgi:gliding motility-associated-like protein